MLADVYALNEVENLGPVAGAQKTGTILTTQLRKPGVTVTEHTKEQAGIASRICGTRKLFQFLLQWLFRK